MQIRQLAWADTDFDVAIVGGGASGILVAAELLRSAHGGLRVAVIEPRPRLGRGVAYSTADPAHLLNVPAGRMSGRADQPDHFLLWLQERVPEAVASTFARRLDYGRYLEDLLDEALRSAAAGTRLRCIHSEVTDVELSGRQARLELADGQSLTAGAVVLAIGHPPAERLPFPGVVGLAPSKYVADPWSPEALADVPQDADLLLVGSGLTAIDLVSSLAARGHQGKIHLLSRHGLLPRAHDLAAPLSPGASVTAPEGASVRGLLQQLRNAAGARKAHWRQAVDSLRGATPALFRDLGLGEKRRFYRHANAYWSVHRHRMAPEVAQVVAGLLESGQLVPLRGRLERLESAASGVKAELRLRGDGRVQHLEVGRVLQCTGPVAEFGRSPRPLLARLRQRGYLRPDELGIALDADPSGRLIDGQGRASRSLWTLGPPLRGNLLESTAIPEIRTQAHRLAAELLAPGRVPAAESELARMPIPATAGG